MGLGRRRVLEAMASVGLATSLGTREASAQGRSRQGRSIEIERDVCIIGGGAAGTYAALGLRDRGRSVVVVEKSERLGGHCETFRDPASGAAIDIGVIVFPDNDPAVPAPRMHLLRYFRGPVERWASRARSWIPSI
jgi:monoamine oxidase